MAEKTLQWWDMMEQSLQCPVCLELPPSRVFQCANGHHLCGECRNALTKCPLCMAVFITTRNILAEELSSACVNIMPSLFSNELNMNRLPNTASVAIQTDPCTDTDLSSAPTKEARDVPNDRDLRKRSTVTAPRVGKGVYPCRLGSCTTELPHGRIIGHIRHYHKDLLYECDQIDGTFTREWSLMYMAPRDYHVAFHIKDMGLFFVSIIINGHGTITGYAQIVNCVPVSKQFSYILKVGCGQHTVSHDAKVTSCRTSPNLVKECLFIPSHMMHHMLSDRVDFSCGITITRTIPQEGGNARDPHEP